MRKVNEILEGMAGRIHMISGNCEKHGASDVWLPIGHSEWLCVSCAEERDIKAAREKWADDRRETLNRVATVPAKYVGCKFVPSTNEHRAARMSARKFMEATIAGGVWTSLALSGEAGTGKTLMAAEMIETFIARTLKTARYITATGMIAEIHTAYRSDVKTEAGEIKRFADYELLVIDEIDLIRSNDNSQGLLTEVVNARYNASKPTIVITNKPREELVKYVGSRVDDRLYENGYLALFTWPSFRRLGSE